MDLSEQLKQYKENAKAVLIGLKTTNKLQRVIQLTTELRDILKEFDGDQKLATDYDDMDDLLEDLGGNE